MDEVVWAIKMAVASAGVFLAQILGGFDQWLKVLLVFMVMDIVTGIIKAVLNRSDKSKLGGVDSAAMWAGGLKKIMIIFVVVLASLADTIINPTNNFIRAFVIAYYVAGEGLSILENAGACGVPLPKKLIEVLEQLKDQNNINKIKENENDETTKMG